MSSGRGKRAFLLGLCALCALLFSALGVWQLERRVWKLDLIRRVDARIHADPVAAPGPAQWPAITREKDEYRRVRLRGTFAHDRETLVQAVTDYGGGYWVVTPLRTASGTVLVNCGFVPPERRAPSSRVAGQVRGIVEVDGLIRMSEPGGAFLRDNDPRNDRWYSRDVAAIGSARRLGSLAPYFIDAGPAPNPGGWPKGGLTVVSFRNAHLQYALTWFALALLSVTGAYVVLRGSPRW